MQLLAGARRNARYAASYAQASRRANPSSSDSSVTLSERTILEAKITTIDHYVAVSDDVEKIVMR